MSHELDMSNNRVNFAFVGENAWHGLGNRLTEDASIETWTQEAGLGFTVLKAPVQYIIPGQAPQQMPDRSVLYRHDTLAPLGLVTGVYKIVQPKDIMEFMRKICALRGFKMETAGSIYGGAKVWALARIGEDAQIVGNDKVSPYVFIVTSFDGSYATTVMFTSVRVVCRNTVGFAMSAGEHAASTIRIPHASHFNPEQVKAELGIGVSLWEKWVARSQRMAEEAISAERADEILVEALKGSSEKDEADIRESKAYVTIMKLFGGNGIASHDDATGTRRTKWGLINATTEYFDHHVGRKAEARFRSSLLGQGGAIKLKVQELLAAA